MYQIYREYYKNTQMSWAHDDEETSSDTLLEKNRKKQDQDITIGRVFPENDTIKFDL